MRQFAMIAVLIVACDRGPLLADDSTAPARVPASVPARVSTNATVPALAEPAPLRIGGEVVAPVVTRRVLPVYPEYRGTYRQGIVLLECVVTKGGEVRDLRVLKGPGNEFEQAILDAVKQWKFKPATLHDKPVDVIFNLSVNHVPYGSGG